MIQGSRKISFPLWEKKGRIFTRERGDYFKTHATRPIPFYISQSVLRIFFASRCTEDTMHPTYIDVNPENPQEILYINERPIMSLGKHGCFDDSGICPVSIELVNGSPYMYYAGLKRRRLVGYETSIGVARLNESLTMCERIFDGPIIAQDRCHPILTAAPFVRREGQGYKMWYCSASEWINVGHSYGSEPVYTVFYGTSTDGFNWHPNGGPLLEAKKSDEVITAPWVERIGEHSFMWYSYRGCSSPQDKNYKIGLSVSIDGINWTRVDESANITTSASGWDSEMVCYPSIYYFKDKMNMLYCGNGVGRDGFGWAQEVIS